MKILGVVLGVCLLETIGWWLSGSLAVLGDVFHTLGDSLAVALSLVVRSAICRGRSERKTRRLGGLVSSILLAIVGVQVIVHAIKRLQEPQEVFGLGMALAAFIGLSGNALQLRIHRGAPGHEHHLTHEALDKHIVYDLLLSALVIAGGLAVALTDRQWIDPALSFVAAAWILHAAIELGVKSYRGEDTVHNH